MGFNMVHILATALLSSLVAVCGAEPTINYSGTKLVGTSYADSGVDFFGGIPFAEPPVGDLRLRRPTPKFQLDEGEFNATASGPICLQPEVRYEKEKSEDCLTLDVYKPSNVDGPLPVMFWVCGGGFWFCGASYYNATNLVQRSVERGSPIMLVSVNYRLGPLGFPQGMEAYENDVLNLGVYDVCMALQWVQHNVWMFGGNKDEVTVFGLSAGSIIGSILTLTPSYTQYFRAAIHQSGWTPTLPLKQATDRESSWTSFLNMVPECTEKAGTMDTLDCLRHVNDSDVFAKAIYPADAYGMQMFPYGPCLDGPQGLIPQLPSEICAVGNFTRVPTIVGTTLDEGPYFIRYPYANYTDEYIHDFLAYNITPPMTDVKDWNETLAKFTSLYPDDPAMGSPYGSGDEAFGLDPRFKRLAAMTGDMLFQSLRRHWQETMIKYDLPTWGFMWTEELPATEEHPAYLGAAHEDNNAFQFGLVNMTNPDYSQLSNYIMDYWLSFATSLTPNDGKGVDRPDWPQYTDDNRVLLQLRANNVTSFPDDYHKEAIQVILDNPVVFHH